MKVEIKNYALSYINVNGEEVLISSNGVEVTLEEKPLYSSYENAEKGRK